MNQNHRWDEYFNKVNWTTEEISLLEMQDAINLVKEKLNKNVIRILKIIKKKPKVFRLELEDNSVLRFDRLPNKYYYLEMIHLEKVVIENFNFISKIVSYEKVGKKILKISEWVDGYLWAEVIQDNKVNTKIGEMFAKLNNIIDPKTGLNITVSEINNTNIIWSFDEEPIIVDLGTIRAVGEDGINECVYKNLVKRINHKNRIDAFLDGYSKYRDISGILKIAEDRNWTFGERRVKHK